MFWGFATVQQQHTFYVFFPHTRQKRQRDNDYSFNHDHDNGDDGLSTVKSS